MLVAFEVLIFMDLYSPESLKGNMYVYSIVIKKYTSRLLMRLMMGITYMIYYYLHISIQ